MSDTAQPLTITLAPMEGIVDSFMRETLSEVGGYDLCVTEFLRISSALLPASTYYEHCPELHNGGRTASGVPVHFQFMGTDPVLLAENAAFACSLGAPGIDLNFGCPSKTVNRRKAGAALLQWPDKVGEIVAAVRAAVPDAIPVSAKMRLGFNDTTLAIENAQAIEAGGAGKLTVHARTRVQGYKPPAHWEWIARIAEAVAIPVVANGDIWTADDYRRCLEVSGCRDVMIGRGAVARPGLALEIKEVAASGLSWTEILTMLLVYRHRIRNTPLPSGQVGRLKQWLKMLARTYGEAEALFVDIRRLNEPEEIAEIIHRAQRAIAAESVAPGSATC